MELNIVKILLFFFSFFSSGEHNICWSEESKPRGKVFYYDHSCEIKIVKLQLYPPGACYM